MNDAVLPAEIEAEREPEAGTGALGMWVFLASEVLFFGGLFVAYLYGRTHWPEGWSAASRRTDVVLGTVNTALLLTSSALAALAVACDEARRERWAARLLAATALLGLAFIAIKGAEWHADFAQGLAPGPAFALDSVAGAQEFFALYFVMTGLHAVHMAAGVGVLGTLAWGRHRRRAWARPAHVEVAALYWHFVDIVWIFLYPLLYLVSRHG